jgi:hypothetical protein
MRGQEKKAGPLAPWVFIATGLIGCLILLASRAEPQQVKPVERTEYVFNDPHNRVAPDVVDAELAKLEESLWEHWTQRREGKFQAIAYTLEGDRTTTTFSFENDAQSRWCVRVDSVFDIRDHPERGERASESRDSTEYYEVKRIELETGRTIPHSEKSDASSYALLFIDKKLHLKWKY